MPPLFLGDQQLRCIKLCKMAARCLERHARSRRKFTDRQSATIHQCGKHICPCGISKECGNGSYDRTIFHTSMLTELWRYFNCYIVTIEAVH